MDVYYNSSKLAKKFVLYYLKYTCIKFISASMQTLLDHLKEPSLSIETGPDRLVRESAQGHTDIVKDIVTKHPDKVSRHDLIVVFYVVH